MKSYARGMSSIEALIAALILAVAIVGAGGFRYRAVAHTRMGERHVEAARIGVKLLECWKAQDGTDSFDPTDLAGDWGMHMQSATPSGLATPADFTLHGQYSVTCGESIYFAALSKAVPVNGVSPAAVNVVVGWRIDSREAVSQTVNRSLGFTGYMDE